MQDADQFFGTFDKLMKVLTRRRWSPLHLQAERLVVFIDELDRCTPNDVVRTLADLMTFLDHKQCVFVVAADREAIEEALEHADQAKPIRENEPYYSTSGAYLDKVFQHQLTLPPPRAEALTTFAMKLANSRGGLWAQLKQDDERIYEDVVYSLVPAHVRSPRRVKVLMNNFVTNWHVMKGRHMHPQSRATELAVMTVLQTEFPSVVRDLQQQPLLLDYLADPAGRVVRPELSAMAEKYTPHDEPTPNAKATPSPLLTGEETKPDVEVKKRARNKLNEQLNTYLAKIHAAQIDLPKTDLIYLQPAAHANGLSDPKLAELLDLAADTAPDSILNAFEGAPVGDLVAAVRFLATQIGNNWGAPRANLIETASRLSLRIPTNEARLIAREVAPNLLSEARDSRWRAAATPGVLRLGLLDEHSNTVDRLRSANLLDDAATDGTLETLTPHIAELREAAEPLYGLYGSAYATEYELVHRLYGDLPADQVAAMWQHQQKHIRLAVLQEDELEPKYFVGMLDALITREAPDVQDVTTAIALLIRDDNLLYDNLHKTLPGLFENGITDQRLTNAVITTALTLAPPEHLNDWSKHLDPTVDLGERAPEAAERLGTNLANGTIEANDATIEVFEWLAPSLNDTRCEHIADATQTALIDTPLDGTPDALAKWTNLRRILRALKFPATIDYETAFTYHSLVSLATAHGIPAAGINHAIATMKVLTAAQAQGIVKNLAGITGTPDQLSHATRLRIAAQGLAGQPPLPFAEIQPYVTGADGSGRMNREWLLSNPPMAEANKFFHGYVVPASLMEVYARQRNASERSKIWIQLEKRDRDDDILQAVGRYGVNATVVAHMNDRILTANMADLPALTKRLSTINISANTPARNALQDIEQALLATKRAGVGQPVVRLILETGGAAPSRKPELRKALDAYTKSQTKHRISQADLRNLNQKGLLSKHKRSPLAKFFDW